MAFLGTFARPAQEVWLPGNDIQDPTTWSVPSLRTLKHLHENLLQDYDCTEQPVANQPAQPSGASTSQDQQPTASGPIPSQRRLTRQLTAHWPPFKALRQRYAGTRFEEQRMLHMPQKHKATVSDSTLRMEMNALEEQAGIAKARELHWKTL